MEVGSREVSLGQYQTFVVRLWTGATEDGLRGHIQHIASRRGVYFRDTDRMLQFIHEYLEPVSTTAEGGGRMAEQEGQAQPSERGEADDR